MERGKREKSRHVLVNASYYNKIKRKIPWSPFPPSRDPTILCAERNCKGRRHTRNKEGGVFNYGSGRGGDNKYTKLLLLSTFYSHQDGIILPYWHFFCQNGRLVEGATTTRGYVHVTVRRLIQIPTFGEAVKSIS